MQKAVYMVGNAHLDPVWLWRWPEGLQAARATFRSALDRMEETPGFVFTSSQASVYAWLERTEPAMFAEIKQRVAEGRWVIVGGWWVQPDCNIPCGESFARQSLYGKRYFAEKFGVDVTVGYNVDSFGHNAMLPQILRLSGMHSYVFMRPGKHEKPDLPSRLFTWESPDGSQVTTFGITGEYGTWGNSLEQKLQQFMDQVSDTYPIVMCFYGVGNHGGGPTKENLAIIEREMTAAAADPAKPEVLFGDPVSFFSVANTLTNLPVVHDELQHHASGCYAVESEIKANNRRSEHALATAEKLAVAAGVLAGFPYPLTELAQGWKAVLFNQFHDIMAGTSISEAYYDARNLHGQALQIATEIQAFALQSLAATVDLTAAGLPIVVFNPHSYRRVGPVELELHAYSGELALQDSAGKSVLCQETKPSAVVNSGRRALTFVADVPPLGYATYWLRPPQQGNAPRRSTLQAGKDFLGNEHLWLRIDLTTGYISEFTWKKDGWRVTSGAAAVPVVIDDPSDTWSHGVFHFHNEVGRFSNATLTLLESGPVRATLRAESHYGKSTVVQDFTVYAGLAYVDVHCTIDWHEQQQMLKLEFPVNVADPQATYEIQYGAFERPVNGEEEPALHWFDVTGSHGEEDQRGLAILNDAKYSYDVKDNRMRLTVLRSPVYAHHDPKKLDPNEHYRYIDQGRQEFTYRLVPHNGSWRDAGVPQLGHELNVPFAAVVESNHGGSAPTSWSLLTVSAPNVLISALKRAEDNHGTIVRLYEAYGTPTVCHFAWLGGACRWQAEFRPFEIKTFLVNDGETPDVTVVDLMEKPV